MRLIGKLLYKMGLDNGIQWGAIELEKPTQEQLDKLKKEDEVLVKMEYLEFIEGEYNHRDRIVAILPQPKPEEKKLPEKFNIIKDTTGFTDETVEIMDRFDELIDYLKGGNR